MNPDSLTPNCGEDDTSFRDPLSHLRVRIWQITQGRAWSCAWAPREVWYRQAQGITGVWVVGLLMGVRGPQGQLGEGQ